MNSPGRVWVGTAGWSYPDWNGTLYPKPMPRGVDRLTYIARYFDVVEVNNTFYRPATAAVAESWLEKTHDAPNFRFTLKLWQRFTHERETAWTRADEQAVREAITPMQAAGKLGAVLVQFPWSFRQNSENHQWLGDIVSAFADVPLVVEVRHESWNTPEFFDYLTQSGVGIVNIDQPLFKKSIKPSARATSAIGYIRVHGRNYQRWWSAQDINRERYDYLYTVEQLRPWVARAEEVAKQTRDTYVITNNHNLGKAGVNALQMKALLSHAAVPAPPTLFAGHQDVLSPYAVPQE